MLHKEIYHRIADAAGELSLEIFRLHHTFEYGAEKTLNEILRSAERQLDLAIHYCYRRINEN